LTARHLVCTVPIQTLYRKENAVKRIDILAAVLLVVGGINWGLVSVAEFDLVAALVGLEFGETNAASRVVYGLVGLAAAYQVAQQGAIRRRWSRSPQVTSA
jgi:uncharacterized protein